MILNNSGFRFFLFYFLFAPPFQFLSRPHHPHFYLLLDEKVASPHKIFLTLLLCSYSVFHVSNSIRFLFQPFIPLKLPHVLHCFAHIFLSLSLLSQFPQVGALLQKIFNFLTIVWGLHHLYLLSFLPIFITNILLSQLSGGQSSLVWAAHLIHSLCPHPPSLCPHPPSHIIKLNNFFSIYFAQF